jgi:hypothetical protein
MATNGGIIEATITPNLGVFAELGCAEFQFFKGEPLRAERFLCCAERCQFQSDSEEAWARNFLEGSNKLLIGWIK